MASLLSTLAPVFATPEDVELRAVVADKLQQVQHPWGELIALQIAIADGRGTPAARTRVRELLAEHVDTFAGPIAKVASTLAKKKCLGFERGFLTSVVLDRRQVPRAAWEAAAKAPQWATVESLQLSVLTTPQWWVAKWARNPAATRSLRRFDVSNALVLERATPADRWTLVRAQPSAVYAGMLRALLPARDLTVAAKVPAKHRAFHGVG